ncbi:Uncharacterised protein [uncultured archaeon]|nr:Uncharacterised protein [uncultured archaeon]
MISKKGDFNFVWLFAIIAGTAFLLLAIFFAVKFGGVLKTAGDTSVSKSLEILTDPLQTGFVEAKTSKISFGVNTQLNPSCYDTGFGYHMLSTVTESDALKKNPPTPIEIKIPNKYIFAQQSFGKDYYIFSKKFELGFPVADMLFISTTEYCLVNPPLRIKEEIMGLNPPKIKIQDSENNTCSEKTTRVCFGYADNCNMTVSGTCFNSNECKDQYETGTVSKDDGNVNYIGDLLYGAIFSNKDLYECNVKRLLYRTAQIADTYYEKANLMDARGCSTNLNADLDSFSQQTINATAQDLPTLFQVGKQLQMKKEAERGGCGVW